MLLDFNLTGLDYERFKTKARDFLRQYENKLRRNLPIAAVDLKELLTIVLKQASGDSSLVDGAKEDAYRM